MFTTIDTLILSLNCDLHMRAFTHRPLAIKVDNPYLVTSFFLLGQIYLSGICGLVWLQERMPIFLFKRHWIECSKCSNHSKLDRDNNGERERE